MSAMDPALRRLQRRLERWELEHLRNHAAELAAQVEDLQQRLDAAESAADFWWQQAENLRESAAADGLQLGLTVDGHAHVLAPREGQHA